MAKPKVEPNYMYFHSLGLFCPYCSYQQTAAQITATACVQLDEVEGMHDEWGKEKTYKCQSCDKPFVYAVNTTVTFKSRIK